MNGSKVRKWRRIYKEVEEALDTETVHGYVGGAELVDYKWLCDELMAAWEHADVHRHTPSKST